MISRVQGNDILDLHYLPHNAPWSIQEMVRQYREELSYQTTDNDVPANKFLKTEKDNCKKEALSPNEEHYARTKTLKNKRHVWWHDSLTNNKVEEKINSYTPHKVDTNNLGDFQDLNYQATKVLQRSHQVIGGSSGKTSMALISQLDPHVDYIKTSAYVINNENSPFSFGKAKTLIKNNHYCTRDVVARNFEKIDQILGKSNLVMELSSSCDIPSKALEFTKVKKGMPQTFKESKFKSSYGGAKHLKQDMEAREEAAIKAANYYLNKVNRDSSIQSKRLLENLTEEEFASISQHSMNASYKLVSSVDQAYNPSSFNTNKQQEWQTTMPLRFATLETCQGTMICDKLVPNTSSITPVTYSEVKCLHNFESNKQQYNNNIQVDSKTIDFPSLVERKGTLKYEKERNFIEDSLDTTKLIKWKGGLPLSSKNCATSAIKQQSRTMDIDQCPFSRMDQLMKESSKIKDIFSIQMSPSRATCIWQKLGVYNPNVPISKSQNFPRKLVRRDSYGSLCLEDGMRQLSTKDLLLTLENPRKIQATLKSMSSKEQFDASCGGQKTFKVEPYLPPKSSFTGSLNGKDELTTNSTILTSFEQDYKEASNQTSPQGLEFHGYLQKSNSLQRRKLSHFDPTTHLLRSNSKFQGIKNKDNKSPAWMHSLNVRKPTKWRAMSTTHTRLQASLAKLTGAVVEEREQLALRHDRSKHTTLAAVIESTFKGRPEEEDFDNDATTVGSRQARITNGFAETAETTTSSELASIRVKPSFTRCSDSDYDSTLNRWMHGSVYLANGTSFSGVSTAQENRCVTASLFAQDDARFDHSTFSSNLDFLISEVVYEWVERCGVSLPASSACDGSQELGTVNPITTNANAEEVGTNRRYRSFSPEKSLEMQASKSLLGDSDLVTDVRKTSVAALASVVKPLLAALHETQIEESIVKEFEADETICLLLEKLQLYETKIQALKNRRKNKNLSFAGNQG